MEWSGHHRNYYINCFSVCANQEKMKIFLRATKSVVDGSNADKQLLFVSEKIKKIKYKWITACQNEWYWHVILLWLDPDLLQSVRVYQNYKNHFCATNQFCSRVLDLKHSHTFDWYCQSKLLFRSPFIQIWMIKYKTFFSLQSNYFNLQ